MHWWRWVRVVAAVWILASLWGVNGVGAQEAESSVSLQVGGTVLEVTGKTTPNGFVTISRDGSVIGTTTADVNGDFGRSFTAQEPGIHELSLFAHTVGGANTDTVATSVNLAEHTTTTVDIFLPPTIELEDTTLETGQDLSLSGEATPSCTVTVFIDNNNYTITTSDQNGNWSLAINTDALAAGQHSLFVRLNNSFGQQSYPTAARSFTKAFAPVIPPETPPSAPQIPDIFNPSAPSQPVQPPNQPTITFPTPGTTWNQPTITVTGMADPGVQIELWDDNNTIGSTFADDNGNWSITIGLVPKDYKLRARACNRDVCSNFTDTVELTAKPGQSAIYLKLDKSSFSVQQDSPISLRLTIAGGTPAYTIKTQWGDTTSSDSSSTQTKLDFSHIYMHPGQYTGIITVIDARGITATIQFTADVQPRSGINFWLLGLALILLIVVASLALFVIRQRRRRRQKANNQRHRIGA